VVQYLRLANYNFYKKFADNGCKNPK